MTFQVSAWYGGYGYAVLATVAAIALYGFKTSLGVQLIVVGREPGRLTERRE